MFLKIVKSKEYKLIVRLWLKNGCLQLKIYISELLNLSIETMKSIVEDFIDLLQDKSHLLSPYRSVFVINLPCFFKMLSSIFLILIIRECLAD